VVTAAPESDFVGETRSALQTLAVIIGSVTVLQVLLIAVFAGRVGSRLNAMSTRFRSIRRLQFEEEAPTNIRGAWIRELADLESGFQLLLRSVETFSRFVPRGVVAHLVTSDESVGPGVHQRTLALFFCDLQGFTSVAERVEPEVLLQQITEYFDAVTSGISAEGGTVDKFIGDAVMAFWGAPDPHPDPALAAARAALRVRDRFHRLSQRWEAEGLPPLRLRIGVHIAPVLVGTIGTEARLSYTALGDGVNVAARLEGANRELDTSICVSDAIRAAAPHLLCRPLRPLTVKGRQEPLLVHELLGVEGSDDAELQAPQSTDVRIACGRSVVAALQRAEWAAARAILQTHLQQDPHDRAARAVLAWLAGRSDDVQRAGRGRKTCEHEGGRTMQHRVGPPEKS
jgi:adenylate cyclase